MSLVKTAALGTRQVPALCLGEHAYSMHFFRLLTLESLFRNLGLGRQGMPERPTSGSIPLILFLHRQHVWDYQEARDYENLKETWKACEQLGLSFYDTAEIYGYGESERIIGKLLRDSSEEYRKKVVIATKCE
jgi:aryl-alcohol dehydrogenase-like predicted oxidoreductase